MFEEVIRKMADEICKRKGFILFDLEVKGNKNNPVFSVFVDNEKGITLKECETFSRELQDEIDMSDNAPINYRLDVSSPGLDKPLKYDFQFKKNIGRDLEIIYRKDEKQNIIVGQLESFNENEIILKNNKGELSGFDRNKIIQVKIKLKW